MAQNQVRCFSPDRFLPHPPQSPASPCQLTRAQTPQTPTETAPTRSTPLALKCRGVQLYPPGDACEVRARAASATPDAERHTSCTESAEGYTRTVRAPRITPGSGAVQSYLLCAINGPSRFPGALPMVVALRWAGTRACPHTTGKRCLPTTCADVFECSRIPAD